MGLVDKMKDLVSDDEAEDKRNSPAAAAGAAVHPRGQDEPIGGSDQPSEAGSGTDDLETAAGGADAVPGTPDRVPATQLGNPDQEFPA